MKIYYNPKLKLLARELRNNSTNSEIRLWNELKGRKVNGYKFVRQKPIGNYIVDFFCNKLKLVIELDGYSHQFEDVVEKDLRKTDYLESLGIRVIRFDDEEVMNDIDNVLLVLEGVVNEIEEKYNEFPPKKEG